VYIFHTVVYKLTSMGHLYILTKCPVHMLAAIQQTTKSLRTKLVARW